MMFNYSQTKAMLIPSLNEQGTGIAIGGFQHGVSRDLLTDTPEALLMLLKDLDGKRSIDEISSQYGMDKTVLLELLQDGIL